ncbi:hypothetical protein C4D60_Mb03t12790 [Musa balbisiana]|uniref:Nuclear nucleic acid-binding protein C1D n=1 Tax=Musa balbisiana TaxID=52838 RepID=A0A4S8J9G7_MUSBA|nr:hypothetical protein C4D60_Mb03t12790 [Musa balbisiana]
MGRGEGGPAESGAVPIAAISAVGETLATVDDVCSHLHQFLSLADRDVLTELPPLHRARAFLVLAQAASTLFLVKLRCSGIQPDDHPISKEFERISLYREKLERFDEWSKAPLRPSTRLNSQAATRFIGHSLPNLTPEQRQSLRDISRGDFVRIRPSDNHRAKKKRKQQKPERQSARAAAQEFLEKAARELIGAGELGLKGPLQEISDEEDEQID